MYTSRLLITNLKISKVVRLNFKGKGKNFFSESKPNDEIENCRFRSDLELTNLG